MLPTELSGRPDRDFFTKQLPDPYEGSCSRQTECLIKVFPVCHSDEHFMNFNLDNKILIENRRRKISK